MKITFGILLACCVSIVSVAQGNQGFELGAPGSYFINKTWKFHRVEADELEANYFKQNFDAAEWEEIDLPHTSKIEPLVVNDQWQGICWYRKNLEIPASLKDKKLLLEWEAAMNYAEIYLNGKLVTKHHGGYLPIVIDATDYLEVGENMIAVRLDNSDNPVTGPKPLKILDFNMYGGLYRNAKIIVKDKYYISHPILAGKVAGGGVFITTPIVSETSSVIKIKSHIVNEGNNDQAIKLRQTVIYKNNILETKETSIKIPVGKSGKEIIQEFTITDAHLWSPDAPNLYHLTTELIINGEIVDFQQDRFGIREFSFKGNDLYINGKKTFLRGVNRHQEYPFIGYALSDNAQYRDAKKIKEAGFDYVRLSHYPHSPAFMDACDELGLVVIDAILGWQFYNDDDDFRNYCYRSAIDLIRRDRNHPCVLAWEVSLNESDMPGFFMEELQDIVHREYPGEYVYSCGWKPEVYDIYLQARQHRLLHYEEQLVRKKPYVVSEYGDWEYYSTNPGLNQHKYSRTVRDEKSSRQLRSFGESRLLQQAFNIQEAHNDNFNTPAFADGYWVMYDYNRGYADDLEASGIMDIFRLPKFSYYFYKSQRNIQMDTVLKIASYWKEDSPTDIKVYSNCDEVELYLNEKLIARQRPDEDQYSANLSNPPFTFNLETFEPGKLKAVGLLKGKTVIEDLVRTAEKATKLKIWLDESGKKPQSGVNDVLFLYIAAVDKNGTVISDFKEEIDLEINGDAAVLNYETVKAEAGVAAALIRIGDSSDRIEIVARSGDLASGKLEIYPE